MLTLDAEFVQSILAEEFDVFSYSGRFMYGRHCLAVNADGGRNEVDVTFALIEAVLQHVADGSEVELNKALEAISDIKTLMRDARTDSLGLDMVVYWPELSYNDDDQDDDDQDDDDQDDSSDYDGDYDHEGGYYEEHDIYDSQGMTKAQIVAEIDRIGRDVFGYDERTFCARTSWSKAGLQTMLANFQMMAELKRRQRIIDKRYIDRYGAIVWRRIQYSQLRHVEGEEEARRDAIPWVRDLKDYWKLNREISRIWRAKWDEGQVLTPGMPEPTEGVIGELPDKMAAGIHDFAIKQYWKDIDEAEDLGKKAYELRSKAINAIQVLAYQVAADAGVRIGSVVIDSDGVKRIVDQIRGEVLWHDGLKQYTVAISVRLPKMTKSGKPRQTRYHDWVRLQQIVGDVPGLPPLADWLAKYTLETSNA